MRKAGKWEWSILFITCVFVGGMFGPLVILSQVNGRAEYDTAQVVLLNELLKLAVSFVLLSKTSSTALNDFSLREGLPYFIPAFGYFVNNNAVFYVLAELDPATFSVLSNIKVLTTTLLYVLIMKRYPNKLQVVALVILMTASVIHSYGSAVVGEASTSARSTGPLLMSVTVYGIVLLLCSVCMTSFAAVFIEYTVKRNFAVSLHKQNAYLYIAGAALNLLAMLWRCFVQLPSSEGSWIPLSGFNVYTWIIVFNTALQGICVSVIMKHSTNITRLVLACASLVVSASMSIVLFSLQLTGYFLVSTFLVIIALVIYNIASQATAPLDNHSKAGLPTQR